jgi:hypothetical protein
MKLSLEQFLDHLDVAIMADMAGALSSEEKKRRFWTEANKEEDRVAALHKDFDYKFVLTPRVSARPIPCGNMVLALGYKIEGEAERTLEAEKLKVIPGMLKLFPFHFCKVVSTS